VVKQPETNRKVRHRQTQRRKVLRHGPRLLKAAAQVVGDDLGQREFTWCTKPVSLKAMIRVCADLRRGLQEDNRI
jgi:hypothetical protein